MALIQAVGAADQDIAQTLSLTSRAVIWPDRSR